MVASLPSGPLGARHLLFLLGTLLFLCASAQQPSCHVLEDPTCSQYVPVGTQIFVPADPGMDYDQLITYSNRIINLLNFTPVDPLCYALVVQLICLTWLRPCQVLTNGTAIPLPQEPCLDLCWTYYNTCASLQAAVNEQFGQGLFFPVGYNPPLNCSDPPLDNWADNSTFLPTGNSNYTLDGITYTDLPCSTHVSITSAERVCVPPLVRVANELYGTICTFLCPLPSLSDAQYDNAKTMQGVLGWLSWATTAVLILSLLFNPATRDFPRNLILMVACAANVAAGAIILPTYAGYEETWCGGSDTTVTPILEDITFDRYGLPGLDFYVDSSTLAVSSSLCTFQGAMLQFGFLAAVFWWVVIAFNMCLELFLPKVVDLTVPKWKWLRFGIYNAIVWGLAFLCMVIPASAGYIKFVSGATYCFVTSEENNRWILTFWFIPVGLAVFFGVIFFVIAIVRVSILLVALKKLTTLIFLYLRLFVFIFLFLFLFTVIFAYNIQVAANQSSINDGYSLYFQCLIYAEPNCSLDDSVSNYNLVMLKGFAISSLGLFIFLIFFFSWDACKFYYGVLKMVTLGVYHRDLSEIRTAGRMMWSSRNTPSVTGGSSLTDSTQSGAEGGAMDQIRREQEEQSSSDDEESKKDDDDNNEKEDSSDEESSEKDD